MLKKVVGLLLGILVLAMCAGLATLILGGGDSDKQTAVHFPEDEGSSNANKATPSVKPSPRPSTIREGMWEVGKDVKAGKYKTSGATEGVVTLCTWIVRSGENPVTVGTVDKPSAQGLVTLKAGQTFETNGCKDWYAVK